MRHHGCHLRWYVISAYLFSVLIANGKLTMHIQMSIFSVREGGGGGKEMATFERCNEEAVSFLLPRFLIFCVA